MYPRRVDLIMNASEETGNHSTSRNPASRTYPSRRSQRTGGTDPIREADGSRRPAADSTADSRALIWDNEAPPTSDAEPTLRESEGADLQVMLAETPSSFPDYDAAMRYFVNNSNMSLPDAAEAIQSWEYQGGTFSDEGFRWHMQNSPLVQLVEAQARQSTGTRSGGDTPRRYTLLLRIDPAHFSEVVDSMPPQLRSRITGAEYTVLHRDSRGDSSG